MAPPRPAADPPDYPFNPTYFRSNFCNPKSMVGSVNEYKKTHKCRRRRTMERVFGHSCGEIEGPAIQNMQAEWGLPKVREHQRGHHHREQERNIPGASRSMRSSGGTRTASAPSKRTGSLQRKGGEGGLRTTLLLRGRNQHVFIGTGPSPLSKSAGLKRMGAKGEMLGARGVHHR